MSLLEINTNLFNWMVMISFTTYKCTDEICLAMYNDKLIDLMNTDNKRLNLQSCLLTWDFANINNVWQFSNRINRLLNLNIVILKCKQNQIALNGYLTKSQLICNKWIRWACIVVILLKMCMNAWITNSVINNQTI